MDRGEAMVGPSESSDMGDAALLSTELMEEGSLGLACNYQQLSANATVTTISFDNKREKFSFAANSAQT